MSAVASSSKTRELADPFRLAAAEAIPRRPRLLSHVGRWGRARRWLPSDAMRLLDIGCAFGYGSAAVVAPGPPGRVIVGVERDRELLVRARRDFPWLPVVDADARALPIADSCADAVLLLDVVEHMADPRSALAEAHRVLRPGGTVIVGVPHAGPSSALDAGNIYEALRRRRPAWPELDGMAASDDGHHHFTVAELEALLDPWFTVDRVARTGIGSQELVNLAILMLRGPWRAPRAATALMPLHLLLYILDDALPTGRYAYHLAVRAHSTKRGGET
jgi:SAM-dependent methyltransferase